MINFYALQYNISSINYFENIRGIFRIKQREMFARLRTPNERSRWQTDAIYPTDINAFYYPSLNQISKQNHLIVCVCVCVCVCIP